MLKIQKPPKREVFDYIFTSRILRNRTKFDIVIVSHGYQRSIASGPAGNRPLRRSDARRELRRLNCRIWSLIHAGPRQVFLHSSDKYMLNKC